MKVYLDICCLNRPFDDQTQDRVRLEAEAVLLILSHFEAGEWQWIGSEALQQEIKKNPDLERRRRVEFLLSYIQVTVKVEQPELGRAQQLQQLGFKTFDALHLACAERGQADVLLTTDDRMLRLARRLSKQLDVVVRNPLTWLSEAVNS